MKAYYTAGVIYDALLSFGELSEEATDKRKYAKYKAAYIHTCLKNGETPIPGPPTEAGDSDDNNIGADAAGNEDGAAASPSNEPGPSTSSDYSPPPNHPIEFQPHPNPAEISGTLFFITISQMNVQISINVNLNVNNLQETSFHHHQLIQRHKIQVVLNRMFLQLVHRPFQNMSHQKQMYL